MDRLTWSGGLEALATVIGLLIEVPVLIGLVYVALWIRRTFFTRLALREGAS